MSAHVPSNSRTGPRAVAVLAAAAVALCLAPVALASVHADHALRSRFEAFKATYGKTYSSESEEAYRLRVFRENMIMADLHAAANPHATFGVTEMSDLTREEFEKFYANGAAHFREAMRSPPEFLEELPITAPAAVDWRAKGAVTPVKSQGSCGSCWSFATIGNIEGQWQIKGNGLTRLSEQQLVSCDQSNGACNGGWMDRAMAWIIRQHGGVVYTEASWPYVSGQQYVPPCSTGGRQVGARIQSYSSIPRNEEQIAEWLAARGPLAIALDATSFNSYRSGILTSCIARQVNHAVLLVGYSDASNPPYWIIKNSWSTYWGEQGYIRVVKGRNACLLNQYVVTANV